MVNDIVDTITKIAKQTAEVFFKIPLIISTKVGNKCDFDLLRKW